MAHKAERGVFELRQGRVLCVTHGSGTWSAVAAVESLEPGTLADLRALGAPLHLVVTSHRGRVMGIHAHDGADLALLLDDGETPESILGLAKTEGMLFKYGSGTGSNLSNIRSSRELLAGGGTASGPVSFMKGFDAFAGVIKSGGKTRRAAKMVILNADHPDVEEFINCKVEEEKKAWALVAAGYDSSLDGPAYGSVFFQNANNSVRVTDEFMRAAVEGRTWSTRFVTSGQPCETRPG